MHLLILLNLLPLLTNLFSLNHLLRMLVRILKRPIDMVIDLPMDLLSSFLDRIDVAILPHAIHHQSYSSENEKRIAVSVGHKIHHGRQ